MELVIFIEHQLTDKEEVLARLRTFSKRKGMEGLLNRLVGFKEDWSDNPSQMSFSVKDKEGWQVEAGISALPGKVRLHLNLPKIESLDEHTEEMIRDLGKNLLAAVLAGPY